MGLLDSPLRSVTKTVIDLLGRSVTVRIKATGSYDPESGLVTDEDDSDTVLNGVLGQYDVRLIGDLIQVGDAPLYLPASDLASVPDPEQWVIIAGTAYRIVRVVEYTGSEQAVLVELQLRASG